MLIEEYVVEPKEKALHLEQERLAKLPPVYNAIRIVGCVASIEYHQALVLSQLMTSKPGVKVQVSQQGLTPFDWHLFLEQSRREYGNKQASIYKADHQVLVFGEKTHWIGTIRDWQQYVDRVYQVQDVRPPILYKAMAKSAYEAFCLAKNHTIVSLEMAIDNQPIGDLVFELFDQDCPMAVRNFTLLLNGFLCHDGQTRSYRNSPIHRLVPGGWLQGGDTNNGHGDGGYSVFGPFFPDESFALPCRKRGTLLMANQGPHTNASQFIVTLKEMPAFEKRYVVFGQLMDGEAVLQRLESEPVSVLERPLRSLTILSGRVLVSPKTEA